VAGVLLLLLVAVVVDDGPRSGVLTVQGAPTDPPSRTPTPSRVAMPTSSTAPDACRYVLAGEPVRAVLPPVADPAPEPAVRMVLRTSVGDIDVLLDGVAAPCAVHSLRHLAAAGFYDDTPCHRLVDRGIFVLQCGDPTGTGQGGPGYRFAEEALADAIYPRGTVAMVNSGPASTGSQFFLVYDDSPLPPQYTPVGTIGADGLAVLDRVAAAGAGPVGPSGLTPPLVPVQVLGVDVTPWPPTVSPSS
jgi:peptidyl-prolyl cis-trans isomerase B (cyclophilin B)